jgi:hypothetical protein
MDSLATPSRSASFESIPDIGFIQNIILDELESTNLHPIIKMSEFKKRENNGELLPEPLLVEDKSRFVLFPIKYQDVIFINIPNRKYIFSNLIYINL